MGVRLSSKRRKKRPSQRELDRRANQSVESHRQNNNLGNVTLDFRGHHSLDYDWDGEMKHDAKLACHYMVD